MSEKSGWQLSGNAPEAYELYMVPVITERYANHILRQAHLERGQRLLDIACGTGVVTRQAAREVGFNGKVTGVDLNQGMLDVARQTCRYAVPSIEFKQGDATKLALADNSYDVVTSNLALMFFPDRVAALREMNRVTAPGGRLVYTVWRNLETCPAWFHLTLALEKHLGGEAGAIFRSPFITKSVDEARSLTTQAGWKNVKVEIVVEQIRYPSFAEFVRQETESMPVPTLQKGMAEAREAITADVQKAFGHYADDFGMSFPAEIYLVTARK